MALTHKFPTHKRFGLEGNEILIVALCELVATCSSQGVDHVLMGIAHRGRVNINMNVCGVNPVSIFTQFLDLDFDKDVAGDLVYHLGLSIERYVLVRSK